MPRLNVRAMARLLLASPARQAKLLRDQKYPKRAPQAFMTPYYSAVLTGIRQFHKQRNNPGALVLARNNIEGIALLTKRENNQRALDRFEKSSEAKRHLIPKPNSKIEVAVRNVQVRLSADLRAEEAGEDRFIYYHFKATALDAEEARLTLEIADWVLEENGLGIPFNDLEYVDLASGKTYRGSKRRPSVTSMMKRKLKDIEELWPTL